MKKYLKSILLIASLILLAGCSTSNLSTNYKTNIDNNLPTIDSNSIKTISDVHAIALEWKGYTSDNIAGYNIYRKVQTSNGEQFSKIKSLKNKYISHYVDTHLKDKTTYYYAMSVIGKNGKHSKMSEVIQATTLGNIESISFSLAISNLPRQVKILWRPHTNHSVKYYIIQRTDKSKKKWETIKRVKNRLSAEYIDSNLKDNYTYFYRIISVTFNNIISNPSKPIQATTRALPTNIKKMSASTNLAKKIVLTWDNIQDKNIAGYNIFVSTNANMYFKKIATVKKDVHSFTHKVNRNNATRYYKIASFDKDGLQSNLKSIKSITGKTIDIPKTPKITLALIKGNTVIINWKDSDNRAVSYIVEKSVKENLFQLQTKVYKGIKHKRFENSDIKDGIKYKFTVQAVDKDGLVSKKTEPVFLSLPTKKKVKQ
jgi:hypothetical protein